MQIRGAAQFVIKNVRHPLIVAEIGVREGNNAMAMLQEMPIKSMVLVDSYLPYNDGGQRYYNGIEQNMFLWTMVNKVFPYREKISFMFQSSGQASQLFLNNSFDFVYIDGDHSYEGVKRDLESWFNKVKAGGVLGGHDYRCNWPGVEKAVDEFAKKKNLSVIESGASDWRIEL